MSFRRCQDLSNGAMVPGVADVWGRDSEEDLKVLVSPEQLRTQLARVKLTRMQPSKFIKYCEKSKKSMPLSLSVRFVALSMSCKTGQETHLMRALHSSQVFPQVRREQNQIPAAWSIRAVVASLIWDRVSWACRYVPNFEPWPLVQTCAGERGEGGSSPAGGFAGRFREFSFTSARPCWEKPRFSCGYKGARSNNVACALCGWFPLHPMIKIMQCVLHFLAWLLLCQTCCQIFSSFSLAVKSLGFEW